jgi:hypothetical protein
MFFACAKIGSPTGGPKDIAAPVVKSSFPESGSVNFNQTYFDIKFNEYVQLNNIQQNLIVSPPFSEKPKVRIKGKGIHVVLPEEPMKNTTYSFSFLDAISDITEKNAAQSLVYAFSTGSKIDSLRISGHLEDAFTTENVSGAYVLLYRNDNDTAFRLHEPDYLTMSNKKGDFKFFYIAPGKYQLYALNDANYSYTFDQPDEPIAFLDSMIVPSVEMSFDTLDSLSVNKYYPKDISLKLFSELNKNQFIGSSVRSSSHLLEVFFKEQNDSLVSWSSPDFTKDDILLEKSENNDTLRFWINSSSISERDSLKLDINYYSKQDTIGWVNDTLIFDFGKDMNDELEISTNIVSQKLHQFDSLKLELNSLIKDVAVDKITLWHIVNDSTENLLDAKVENIRDRKFSVNSTLNEGETYRLMLDSAAVVDVLNRANDSINFKFEYRKLSTYSELKLHITTDISSVFCELMQGDILIRKKRLDASGVIGFKYLEPGNYQLRMVEDINDNLLWDTGNLEQRKQPEKIWYYPEDVELRANWLQETDWMQNLR